MGHAGNGTCQTLALISLSVFRDHILEPRYYDPYLLEYNLFSGNRDISPLNFLISSNYLL